MKKCSPNTFRGTNFALPGYSFSGIEITGGDDKNLVESVGMEYPGITCASDKQMVICFKLCGVFEGGEWN